MANETVAGSLTSSHAHPLRAAGAVPRLRDCSAGAFLISCRDHPLPYIYVSCDFAPSSRSALGRSEKMAEPDVSIIDEPARQIPPPKGKKVRLACQRCRDRRIKVNTAYSLSLQTIVPC